MEKAIHIYQRSIGGVVLFYTLQDYLVYYSVFSVYAKRYGVAALGLAIMYDHLHCLAISDKRQEVEPLMSAVSSVFARLFNAEAGLSGPLFQRPFGSAVKTGSKNIRTAAGYLYNNHTNKKLCDSADKVRWNFLAFAHNSHPFSDPVELDRASRKLRSALKEVKVLSGSGRHLNYGILRRLYNGLDRSEKEQLTDFIIDTYRVIDYGALEHLYRSYDDMLYSFNANTFNEYDIQEDEAERRGDDRVFNILARQIMSSGRFSSIKEILLLPDDEKLRLAVELKASTGVSYSKIGSYLHLKITFVRNVIKEEDFLSGSYLAQYQ